MAVDATKTTLEFDSLAMGHLMGEVPTPDTEVPTEKFQSNDDVNPALIPGKVRVGDIEHKLAYVDHATYAAIKAKQGVEGNLVYTLADGSTFTFNAVLSKVGPASEVENKGYVGKVGFVISHLVSSSAGA